MARRRFQVAPNGNTVGLFLSSNGVRSLAVVVYPKLWQPKPVFRQFTWKDADKHLAIAAGELDTIEVEGGPELVQLLDAPLRRTGSSKEPLVHPLPSTVNDQGPIEHTVSISPNVALLGIEALMRRTRSGSVLPVDAGFAIPHLQDPLLRPILYRHFLDEVTEVIRLAQREYKWAEEDLPFICGRPNPSSLLIHEATGWPRIRCSFQEFDRRTPTLIAISTALDHVASDGTVGNAFGLGNELRDEAVQLRRLLADVPTTSRELASRIVIEAQRTNGSQEWSRALQLAGGVLRPEAGVNLGDVAEAVEIAIDSSRVWELLLLELLRSDSLSAFDGNSPHGMPLNVERPWCGLGTHPPRPDLLVGNGASWVVIDAKYKDLAGAPAIDDLYQMFAYSHLGLMQGQGHIVQLALAYPAREDTLTGPPNVFRRAPDRATSLAVHRVRFPTIHECQWLWHDYVVAQGEAFRSNVLPCSPVALTA